MIKEQHLEHIIQVWIEDIKQGYRESKLTLYLPLLIESNIDQLQESGNQIIPQIVDPDLSGIEPSFGMLPPLSSIF